MDQKGYPLDSRQPGRQQSAVNAQLAQALEMEEALFLHRQQELDRDIQLQRLLLQEQIQKEAFSNAASLHSRFYFGGGLAAQYEQELLLQRQQEFRRQQQLQAQQNSDYATDRLLADSLVASSMMRTSGSSGMQRKRSFDEADVPPAKRVARSDSVSSDRGSAGKLSDNTKPTRGRPKKFPPLTSLKGKKSDEVQLPKEAKGAAVPSDKESAETAVVIEALAAVAIDLAEHEPFVPVVKGTVQSLLTAATDGDKADDAALTIVKLKTMVKADELVDELIDDPIVETRENPTSDDEMKVDFEEQYRFHEEEEVIELPTFKSSLPLLPCEPELKSLKNDKGADASAEVQSIEDVAARHYSFALAGMMNPTESKSSRRMSGALAMTVDYPYPVDSWWPSIKDIRKERRSKGEQSDEDDFVDQPGLSFVSNALFRANLREIRRQLATEAEPGVLEKLPHCRIHRMAMKSQKVANAPDHAFCWQVTENYCNHPMVCCSICSTWRHAACGGHYKPYTVRETIDGPFVPICDRCNAEQEIIKEYPGAAARLERQRIEQLRRGLSTSHVIRQASFAKHAGTYKWPLGCVSATHIGGHTRSVHSRHDKAEKQWSEMVLRLSRGVGYRPKERIKVRTRELERLLVGIEDSEGVTDRHNMMLFLMQETRGNGPVGYEKRRRNIFDPEDDEAPSENQTEDGEEATTKKDKDDLEEVAADASTGRTPTPTSIRSSPTNGKRNGNDHCAREGCPSKPRFDSIFCSDSCGVWALELDLLHAFQYASDIHPSLLRS